MLRSSIISNTKQKLSFIILTTSAIFIGLGTSLGVASADNVGNTPPAPSITSPLNGATLTTAELTDVTWTATNDYPPLTYQYQAYSNSSYTNLVYSSGVLTTNQISTPNTPDGVYYLRVDVTNGRGATSMWSNGANNPFKVTVAQPNNPPTKRSDCWNRGWLSYNNPAFSNEPQCVEYVLNPKFDVNGALGYDAYGLQRHAVFGINYSVSSGVIVPTGGWFIYSDKDNNWYRVDVTALNISGDYAYFAGKVDSSSNPSWVNNWLAVEVEKGSQNLIWGSFTTKAAALNDVRSMQSPPDGPFVGGPDSFINI